MNTVKVRLLVLFFLTVLDCFSVFSLEVYLKKTVLFNHPDLVVGNVAHIRGESSELIKSISNIPLNLNIKNLVLLPARYVSEQIAKYYKNPIIVIGNRVAIINLTEISPYDVYFFESMLQYLDEIENDKQSRLEIEIANYSLVLKNPVNTEITFQISESIIRNGYLIGKNNIYYKYYASNGQKISGFVKVNIHQYIPVAIARYNISAGLCLNSEIISFKDKDISLYYEDVLLSTYDIHKYQTSINLYKGYPIKVSTLEPAQYIKTGDKITIIFVSDNLYIQDQGRALSSGVMDEAVSVRSYSTNKQFSGIVTGHREVLVEIK